MNKKKFSLYPGFIMIAFIVTFIMSSCDFNKETPLEEDLIGTWNVDSVSAALKVSGIDITQLLMMTYGYLEEDADYMRDSLLNELDQTFTGSISFSNDYSYSTTIDIDSLSDGTWMLNESGSNLSLQPSGGMDILVFELSDFLSTMMELEYEAASIPFDVKKDSSLILNVDVLVLMYMLKEE